MKFKYIIIASGIIIVITIIITALLPLLLSSVDLLNFQYITLLLFSFIVLLIICMSVFLILNYRLLSLLDREDWPALSYYLEQQIYTKGRYSARKVRLLAISYFIVSDYASVLKLESKASIAKPSVIDKNVLIFGSAKILSHNYKEAAAFFMAYMEKENVDNKQWIRWFYGFSQLLGSAFNMAEPEFVSLTFSSGNALITGLSAYFLHNSLAKHSLKPEECNAAAENGRGRVIKALRKARNWDKEADKMRTEIHIAVIRKYIDEAGKWLFNKQV